MNKKFFVGRNVFLSSEIHLLSVFYLDKREEHSLVKNHLEKVHFVKLYTWGPWGRVPSFNILHCAIKKLFRSISIEHKYIKQAVPGDNFVKIVSFRIKFIGILFRVKRAPKDTRILKTAIDNWENSQNNKKNLFKKK